MLNYIWLGLVVCAVVIGGWNGQLKEVTDKCLEMANTAVIGIAFALIGVMALWLGVMRLAERADLVALLARILRPLMIRIFPEVPAEHPAMGSMLMNIAANLLGLGHAATPPRRSACAPCATSATWNRSNRAPAPRRMPCALFWRSTPAGFSLFP